VAGATAAPLVLVLRIILISPTPALFPQLISPPLKANRVHLYIGRIGGNYKTQFDKNILHETQLYGKRRKKDFNSLEKTLSKMYKLEGSRHG
jgi:hypothetical protein